MSRAAGIIALCALVAALALAAPPPVQAADEPRP